MDKPFICETCRHRGFYEHNRSSPRCFLNAPMVSNGCSAGSVPVAEHGCRTGWEPADGVEVPLRVCGTCMHQRWLPAYDVRKNREIDQTEPVCCKSHSAPRLFAPDSHGCDDGWTPRPAKNGERDG